MREEISTEDWLQRWMVVTMVILVASQPRALLAQLWYALLHPFVLFAPIVDVVLPSFERLAESWDLVLDVGTLEQHAGGIWRLLLSLSEFTLLAFKIVTLVPLSYASRIIATCAREPRLAFLAGAAATGALVCGGLPFPLGDLRSHGFGSWHAPSEVALEEAQHLLLSANRAFTRFVGVESLEGWALLLYGHSLFVLAVMAGITLFYASISSIAMSLLYLALDAVVPAPDVMGAAFFVFVVLFPLAAGGVMARHELPGAVALVLPLFGTLFASLAANLATDMQLLVLVNLPAMVLAVVSNGAVPWPMLGVGLQSGGPAGLSVPLGLSDACTSLWCGNILRDPLRDVGDVNTPRAHYSACPAHVTHSCTRAANEAWDLPIVGTERYVLRERKRKRERVREYESTRVRERMSKYARDSSRERE